MSEPAPTEAPVSVDAAGSTPDATRRNPVQRVPEWGWALVGYLAAAIAVTWPLLVKLGSRTYGGPGDGWAVISQTWERNRQGVDYFSASHLDGIAWPFGTVVSTTSVLSNAVNELPHVLMLRMGIGDVAAYNLMMLAGLAASSTVLYVAVRRLGASWPVASWAGLVYMMTPWHLTKASIHPSLSMMVCLPLVFLGIVEFSRRPGWRPGVWLVVGTVLGMYTHIYYGFMTCMMLVGGAFVVAAVALRERRFWKTLVPMAGVGAAVAVAAIPLFISAVRQREESAMLLQRPLNLSDLTGDTYRYLLPSVDNPFFGDSVTRYLADHQLQPNVGEWALYMGWITLVAAVVGVVAAIRDRGVRLPMVVAALLVLTGLVLALPAQVTVPGMGTVTTLAQWIHDTFRFLSTPSRFFALTLTGLVVMAALGVEWLVRRWKPSQRVLVGAMAALSVVSVAELVIWPSKDRLVDATASPVARDIARLVPEGEPVMQFPSTNRSLRPIADQLFDQIFHKRPLVNAASVGTPEDGVRREFVDLSRPDMPARLALLGVRWLTVQPGQYPFAPFAVYGPEMIDQGVADKRWIVAAAEGDNRILQTIAPPAAGIVARAYGGWMEEEKAFTWLQADAGRRGHLLVCVPRAGRHTLSLTLNAFGPPRVAMIGDARLTVNSSPQPPTVRVALNLTQGWQWVTVKALGPPGLRPVDVVPGSADARQLALWVGPVTVEGPSVPGSEGACAGPLPPVPPV